MDTETTGLSVKDGHRIVEVGLVEMKNLNITSLNFHTYINPEREIDFEAQKVHGLTLDFLKDKSLGRQQNCITALKVWFNKVEPNAECSAKLV